MTVKELERISAPPKVREDAREERARVLEAAALELEMRGWAKFTACRTTGEVCGGGAMLFALGRSPAQAHFDDRDVAALNDVWGWSADEVAGDDDVNLKHVIQIAPFNDAIAESVEEVTFLLRWRAEEIRDGR